MTGETVPPAVQAWTAQLQAVARFEPDMPDALVEALFLAQENVVDPEPEGEGTDGKRRFSYVRADQIVSIAKSALQGAGLFVTMGGVRFEEAGPLGALGVAVVRDVVLRLRAAPGRPAHAHTFRDGIRFPIENTRRLANDKATAAAMTTSLAYWLRDLLQISRLMAGDEIEQRQDLPPAPAQTEQPRPAERKSVLADPPAPRAPRSKKAEIRAAVALAGAQLGNPVPKIELGDEQREEEQRQDLEAARIDALAAADGPAQPDPSWLSDDEPATTATPIPPPLVGQGGGESNAPSAEEPHSSALAPAAEEAPAGVGCAASTALGSQEIRDGSTEEDWR